VSHRPAETEKTEKKKEKKKAPSAHQRAVQSGRDMNPECRHDVARLGGGRERVSLAAPAKASAYLGEGRERRRAAEHY
jgi:hypothetical protein